ncbi:MAG: nitroreductase family deazaflavin-dependent oxidoreductase [Ktedonobacteraceae bacterium]
MSSPNDWNQQIIEEFHANGGKVGGQFAGASLLLLHTRGAKSNQPRINPLVYFKDGDKYVIIASKGGAPTNPDWYHNILAHPDVTLEVGTEQFRAHAKVPERQERDRIFADVAKQAPGFGEYQKNSPRVIPVILLERVQ